MKCHATPFLDPPETFSDFDRAAVVIVPFPYEGGVSYGKGAAAGPAAVLSASRQVEFYDDDLQAEPFRIGIATLAEPVVPEQAARAFDLLSQLTEELLVRKKFPIVIGGDHSISSGCLRAFARHYSSFGVIQLDAHADLRDSYEGSPFSHASVMARIREITPHTLQIGIRSMDREEARRVTEEKLSFCTMRQWRAGQFDLHAALRALPPRVFITLDVDFFDWSVIAGTGTPEPGGFGWDEALQLLQAIFSTKEVIGCDLVELAPRREDLNSPYAAAKLIYKMIGFKFASHMQRCAS